MIDRSFVFADPNRCIGCKTCMVACIGSHSEGAVTGPRLQLVTTMKVSAPVSCRHCLDAPCVKSCPTGTLYSDGSRVGIREQKCIGCQNCVLACPFGAIAIGSKPKREMFGGVSLNTGSSPVVIKCDLCSERGRKPACVESCPTEGLFLANDDFIARETDARHTKIAQALESLMNSTSSVSLS